MIIALDKHIKVIRPEGKAIFPYSNSVFIDDDVKALIDAGAGGRAYADLPMNKIELLLLTHHHFDHIHGMSFFENARKMVGQEELWAFTDENKYWLSSGYQHWEEIMGARKEGSWQSSQQMPDDVPIRPGFQAIHMDGVFRDGDEFQLGETLIKAIHTPGHSPGHYAFFFPEQKILFSADLDISPRGPWYGGEYSDFDDIVQSIHKMIELKPEILVTSHRKIFYEQIEQLLQEYINIGWEREMQILDSLALPRTLDDLTLQDMKMAYNTLEKSPHTLFWGKMMILKHLQRLLKLGQIKELGNYRYVRI